MQYEIETKLGGTDQVGLRLKCGEAQAENIYLKLRQQELRLSHPMTSNHSGYDYFLYVTATEFQLRQMMSQIQTSFNPDIAIAPTQTRAAATQNFQAWQTHFRKAVKTLNKESPRPTSSTQEIDQKRLVSKIADGQTTEVEGRLLQQANLNDSNALRTLIALYTQTEQHEQIVALYKTKRSNIMALPVSGRLVEQLVSAHIQYSQQTNIRNFFDSAKQIAQDFLPELERLRQANDVRQLLNQSINAEETPPNATGVTLSEQLAQLLEIEPGERSNQLESLRSKYPKATNVLLALAKSYTAIDRTEDALLIYQSIPEKTEEIKKYHSSLLLDSRRFEEVLHLLPDESNDELSPILSGLRGVALYYLGQKALAREHLETAWHAEERNVQILLPLGRLWAEFGDPLQAGMVYQILQETAEDRFELEDLALMARIANLGGFGDIAEKQTVEYYERFVAQAGVNLTNFSKAKEMLSDRLALWISTLEIEGILNAYGDLLDWLASVRQFEDLETELAKLRELVARQSINRQQQFELLEIIEPYIDAVPQLSGSLANDYSTIAIAEIDSQIRQAQSEAPFFEDLKRALFNLDKELLQEIVEYQQQKCAEAQELGIQIVLKESSTKEASDLSSLNLALVGGHEATRRAVIRELQENYQLKSCAEVAPSDEAYINRNNVQTRINNCDLVAMITGYMGHDLSKIVSELNKDDALVGEVLPLSCRGKSGVVREILSWWEKQHLKN
jgi:hypothetical protein